MCPSIGRRTDDREAKTAERRDAARPTESRSALVRHRALGKLQQPSNILPPLFRPTTTTTTTTTGFHYHHRQHHHHHHHQHEAPAARCRCYQHQARAPTMNARTYTRHNTRTSSTRSVLQRRTLRARCYQSLYVVGVRERTRYHSPLTGFLDFIPLPCFFFALFLLPFHVFFSTLYLPTSVPSSFLSFFLSVFLPSFPFLPFFLLFPISTTHSFGLQHGAWRFRTKTLSSGCSRVSKILKVFRRSPPRRRCSARKSERSSPAKTARRKETAYGSTREET